MSAAAPPDPSHQPGAYLRHHRQRLGLDLQHIAAEIRVSPAILSKIEHEEREGLPAPVFVRGFVLQYARALGLPDAEKLANAFLETMDG
ncbi:MAG: helix-turn-helix domain-containing protein [Acidobacteriota bacterium]